MNDIYATLKLYNQAGFTIHTHHVLFERLVEYKNKYPFTERQTRQLQHSIQYPLMNGLFVVMLDRCNKNEFRRYMTHSIIPQRLKVEIGTFYKQARVLPDKSKINVHTFNLPSFEYKTIQYHKNRKPNLTSILYKK